MTIRRNILSFAEQREIEKALSMVCTKTEDGFAEYAPDWSDVRMAKHATEALSITATRWNIVTVREAAIGKLRPAAPLLDAPPAGPLDLEPILQAVAQLRGDLTETHMQIRQDLGALAASGTTQTEAIQQIHGAIADLDAGQNLLTEAVLAVGSMIEQIHSVLSKAKVFKGATPIPPFDLVKDQFKAPKLTKEPAVNGR